MTQSGIEPATFLINSATNYELYETLNETNTVNYIKIKRLAWAGHFWCIWTM